MLRWDDIDLVFNLTYQLFQDVLDSDHPRGRAKLVHHYREMPFPLFEFFQKFGEDFGFGYDQNVVHDLADFHVSDARQHRLNGVGGVTQAGPTHQVLGVEHSDDVFWAALRVIDGNARVLLFDYASQGFFQGEVAGERKNVRARDHDLAD